MKKPNRFRKIIEYMMLFMHNRLHVFHKGLLLLLLLFTLPKSEISAQDNFTDKNADPFVTYDEIPVHVILEGYQNFYLDVIYTNNDILYINIQELFYALHISCNSEQKGESLSGFIGNKNQAYLIDYNQKQIEAAGKTFDIKNEIIKEFGMLYMSSSLFAEVFGITLTFNFRSLTLVLKTNFELPIVKQQRLKKMRSNISKVQGEVIADTILKRNYHLFKPGMVDWSIASYQSWNETTDNLFSIGLGTELLYGEADISVNYYDKYEFDNRQLHYLWRWVDNDKKLIKQAQIGKISNQTISFINSPVIGAVVRNSPTTLRKASGYYTINEFTEPNWTVELYINNVLVDYTKADASGLFSFKVPIVYGYTTLKLKFFGPMGEEHTEERSMNMPYTIMPAKEFEYSLSGGIVQDSTSSRFGRADFNYGVNRFLTIGGGLEYLSSISNRPFIPYAKATIQPNNKLTLNAEYAHGVKARGLLDYYFWKNALLVIDYTKFAEGQQATRFNALEELKVKLSLPFRFKKIIGFSKFDYSQFVYNAFNFNQASIMVSTYYKQFSANSSTQINWVGKGSAFVLSDLALSYRLKNGFIIRPSSQYNVSENRFTTYKVALEKSIPKGYFSFNYERNVMSDHNLISLSLKYDLNFARTNTTVSLRNGSVYTSESAQGSLAFGSGNNYVHKSNNSSVSKGGISLYPFLDLNQNGIFDTGEKPVKVSSVRVMGKVIYSEKDSIIRITGLNAFTNYMVEFDDYELENIAWRFKHKKYQVLIDPNQFKRIDVPVIPVGEISGMTYRNINNSLKGIGRILVNIYEKNGTELIAKTLSEYDGYTYYLGLKPGEYVARIDTVQLNNLDFISVPEQINFNIKAVEEGDIIEGINFVLNPLQDSLDIQKSTSEQALIYLSERVSTIKDPMLYTTSDTLYKVQLLAMSESILIEDHFTRLLKDVPELSIEETLGEDGLYHYSTKVAFTSLEGAYEFQGVIQKSGWRDSFVAFYAGIKSKEGNPEIYNEKQDLDGMDTTIYRPIRTLYNVQLLALSKPIMVKDYFTQLLADVPGLIIEEILGKDGLYHYSTVLSFSSLLEAHNFQRIIQASGWKDSFVATYARKKNNPEMYSKEDLIGKDIMRYSLKDTLYKVQLLALSKPIEVKDYFTQLTENVHGLTIEETLGEDGLYHYSTVMAFSSIEGVREFQRIIRESGWKDSFIAFYSGRKNAETISRIKFNQSTKRKMAALMPIDTLYKVQLLAIRAPIRVKGYFKKLQTDMPRLMIEEILGEDGLFHYSTGSVKSMDQARKLLQQIKQSGWESCFISIYKVENQGKSINRIKHYE